MQSWRNKAEKIIADLSTASYLKANTTKNGKRRKRHVPYTIPEEAEFLIKCLNENDEESAKFYFVYGFMP